jgi:hypothetical protein
MEIHARGGDIKLEWRTARQRLAPQELVIPPECWTGLVRIYSGHPISGCVRSEVEGDVNDADDGQVVLHAASVSTAAVAAVDRQATASHVGRVPVERQAITVKGALRVQSVFRE